MLKRTVWFGLLFIGMAAAALAQPLITITQPPDGKPMIMGLKYDIKWTHSAYYNPHNYTCTVFCGSAIISPPTPVKSKVFNWTAGKKADGSWMAVGNYEITIENDDYDALTGPVIHLIRLIIPPWLKTLDLAKVPNCPGCFDFDPRLNKLDFEGLNQVRLEVWSGNRRLADLGSFRGGAARPGAVRFDFGKARPAGGQVELRVLTEQGELLLAEKIQLFLK